MSIKNIPLHPKVLEAIEMIDRSSGFQHLEEHGYKRTTPILVGQDDEQITVMFTVLKPGSTRANPAPGPPAGKERL